MRRAAKIDANDMALTVYARSLGWHIEHIGLPVDKAGCIYGMFWMIEIKQPERKGRKDEFTSVQKRYMRDCGGKVLVWYSERDIDHDTRLIRTMAEFIHSANQ